MKKTEYYKGLSQAEVLRSREQNGVNVLTPLKKESLWSKFLGKFQDSLIRILLVAGTLSIGIACYEYWALGHAWNVFFEPMGIFIAILLATGLSFYFELIADKASDEAAAKGHGKGHQADGYKGDRKSVV